MKVAVKQINVLLLIATLLSQRLFSSIEVRTIILFIATCYFALITRGKIGKEDLGLISLPIFIIGIGLITSFFYDATWFDLIKDFIYFFRPVLSLTLGYFAARSILDWQQIFKAIIYLGLIYAVYHVGHTFIYTDFRNASVIEIRNINGISNIVVIFAITLLIITKKIPKFHLFGPIKFYSILLILTLSFILYFSRTMFVGLIFLVLGVLDYLKLNVKGLKYLVIFTLLTSSFYLYLFSVEIKRDSQGIESFLYKMKIAPSEIFTPKLDINNHETLWDHWRAYEAYSAFKGLNEEPITYINGRGFGALIDLGFSAPLSNLGNMRYIPFIHNGYVYIIFKTGILGLLFYLYFLFFLYLQTYFKSKTIEVKTFRNLIASCAVYLIFSSLIIVGFYNPDEEIAAFLGVFLLLKSNALTKANNKR